MTRRGMFGTAVMLALASCGRTEVVRYKMTVEVETPQGARSAFSVREVTGHTPPAIPMFGESRGGSSLRGEAVALDMPDGQVLFALLTGADGNVDYAATVPLRTNEGQLTDNIIELWPTAPKTAHNPNGAELPPMLVRFRDIRRPETVEEVMPDALDKAFGPDVALKRITIQHTEENVKVGIGERLPDEFWRTWASIHQKEMKANGGIMKNPYFKSLMGALRRDDFVAGIDQ